MKTRILAALICASDIEMMQNIDKLDFELQIEAEKDLEEPKDKSTAFIETWMQFKTQEELEDEAWLESQGE